MRRYKEKKYFVVSSERLLYGSLLTYEITDYPDVTYVAYILGLLRDYLYMLYVENPQY